MTWLTNEDGQEAWGCTVRAGIWIHTELAASQLHNLRALWPGVPPSLWVPFLLAMKDHVIMPAWIPALEIKWENVGESDQYSAWQAEALKEG